MSGNGTVISRVGVDGLLAWDRRPGTWASGGVPSLSMTSISRKEPSPGHLVNVKLDVVAPQTVTLLRDDDVAVERCSSFVKRPVGADFK